MPIDENSSIKIEGLEKIQNQLTTLQTSLTGAEMKTKMHTIGGMVANSISESFQKEQSPFGEKWRPLAVRTNHSNYTSGNRDRRNKRKTHTKRGKQTAGFNRHLNDKKILRITGALGDRPKWSVKSNSNSVTIGNNVPYAAIHNFGGMAGRGKKVKIPKRQFLPIDDNGNLEKGLEKSIDDYLKEEVEKVLK